MSNANTLYAVKRNGNILHIYDFIYESNYYWFEAKDYPEYCRIIKKEFNIDTPNTKELDGHFGVMKSHGTPVALIWAKRNRPEAIAHECLHAAAYFLRERGIELSEETDEVYAYLMDYLMETILKFKPKKCRRSKK